MQFAKRMESSSLKKQRLVSLDAFRGATVMAMLLVNNPGTWGHIYPPLKHAAWHGCTPTDLIFPFFLLIMGVAIPLSLGKAKREGPTDQDYRHILTRTLRLFLAGLFLATFPFYYWNSGEWLTLGNIRILGVLQRIALVYLACSLLFLHLSWRGLLLVAFAVLAVHGAVLLLVPAPGLAEVSLAQGQDIGAWIDRQLLGSHLWKEDYDPEGLFSTLPAIVSGMIGVLVGLLFKLRREQPWQLLGELAVIGTILSVVGLALAQVYPLNKPLWTGSFVIYTAGLFCLGLGLFYWLLDIRGLSRTAGLAVAFGRNAITAFVLSGVVARLLALIRLNDVSLKGHIFSLVSTPNQPELGSLFYALLFLALFCPLMWWMYKRNIIIKI